MNLSRIHRPFLTGLLIIVVTIIGCDSVTSKVDDAASKFTNDSLHTEKFKQMYLAGRTICYEKCSRCHVPPDKYKADAMNFDDLFQRLPQPGEQYFRDFIFNSEALKDSGNKYAIALDDEWNSDYEHLFKDSLSSNQLEALIFFISLAPDIRNRK